MFSSEVVMVLSAAVLNFCLNGLWYVFFKKAKVEAKDKAKNTDSNPTAYLISFIGSLWASYGLFLIIKHIHPNSLSELLGISLGAWICILMALSAKHYAFNKSSMLNFFKDYLVDLVGLTVMALIIWNG